MAPELGIRALRETRLHAWHRGLALVVFAAALASCQRPAPVDETFEGILEDSDTRVPHDGSPFDEYNFVADEGWVVRVELRSDAFDAYLWLGLPGEVWPMEDDDGLGVTTHSVIETVAPRRGVYRAIANCYEPSERGPYTLRVMAHPPGE